MAFNLKEINSLRSNEAADHHYTDTLLPKQWAINIRNTQYQWFQSSFIKVISFNQNIDWKKIFHKNFHFLRW